MDRIERLPLAVINRIAAGEVVERPASVLRELLDNAIDAGARRINVSLERGGIALVRVVDDGGGIAADDLPLAVAAHATSKLRSADDLERIATLGFRGEALAAIAEVARLVIISRRAGDDGGNRLEVDCGRLGQVQPVGCAVGTGVEVHQLFATIPARRSFLRTAGTEWSHAADVFVRSALAHPEIALSLTHGGRRAYDLPLAETWLERIQGVFGHAIGERLISVAERDEELAVDGFIGRPEADMASGKLQHLFVRGRPFRDRSLAHAIQEAYRGTMLSGRHPIVFLRIDLPPESVDVNVHPAKTEVRFKDPARLYRLVLSAIRTALLSADLSTPLKAPASASPGGHALEPPKGSTRAWGREERDVVTNSFFIDREDKTSVVGGEATVSGGLNARVGSWDKGFPSTTMAEGHDEDVVDTRAEFAVQMHDRYLVVETAEGIEIIDQHALHERLLFERLREAAVSGRLEVQRMLVPEPVELSSAEAELLLEHSDRLVEAGVTVEAFSGGTVLVLSKPAMLASVPAVLLVREILERLDASASLPRERLVEDLLHSLACRAAIKAGDPLSQQEVDTLVRDRRLVAEAHHCPHGRPTGLTLTRRDLDRQFRRT